MTAPLDAGEQLVRELVHDARDDLREIYERWNNRLTWEKLFPLAEQYANGRFSVALYVKRRVRPEGAQNAIPRDGESPGGESVMVLVFRADIAKGQDPQDGNQQPVFVGDVKTVKGPQGIIPSRVWFYLIPNQVNNVGPRSLYISALKGGFQFLPRFKTGETDVLGGQLLGSTQDDLPKGIVEGSAQVMKGVPNSERDSGGQWLSRLEFDEVVTGFGVMLDVQFVGTRLKKSTEQDWELLDVFVGPFDL